MDFFQARSRPLACLIVMAAGAVAGPQSAIPPKNAPVPAGLGVNIHFTIPSPGEIQLIGGAGFQWVRMDLRWFLTEEVKGVYDFSSYDNLLSSLQPQNIHALFILDYTNQLYDQNLAPYTNEGRAAFVRWAAAAVQRFRGRGIIWEMYNEPNLAGGRWTPQPNPADYILLATAVGEMFSNTAPGETFVGPATASIDLPFLEKCFQGGLLKYWSAVTVHPYPQGPPESVASSYSALRQLIARYAPAGKDIPIVSGEWGYFTTWQGVSEDVQAKYLVRQWLTNISNDVPISIWYDWHDDASDPNNPEDHYGVVLYPNNASGPVYTPKPAYYAAQTLTTTLNGWHYQMRIPLENPNDFVLVFSRDGEQTLVAWTAETTPHAANIPASAGAFSSIGYLGEPRGTLNSVAGMLPVILDDTPQYLTPAAPNDLLRLIAAWERLPLEIMTAAPATVAIAPQMRNPLDRSITVIVNAAAITAVPGELVTLPLNVDVLRTADPIPVKISWTVEGIGTITQQTMLIVTNPLPVTVLPNSPQFLAVRVDNPAGNPFAGTVQLTDMNGLRAISTKLPVAFGKGETTQTLNFALSAAGNRDYLVGVRVEDANGTAEVVIPPAAYTAVDSFDNGTSTYSLIAEGDPYVPSTQSLTIAEPPEGPPLAGLRSARLDYQFGTGWKYVVVNPLDQNVARTWGSPDRLGMWVYGDAQGNSARLGFVDSTGQSFTSSSIKIDWMGWRYLDLSFGDKLQYPGEDFGGGANDGIIHYPIQLSTLLRLDSGAQQATKGTIYFSGATFEAAPQIVPSGVLSGGSSQSGRVAPGEILNLFGAGIGSSTLLSGTPENNVFPSKLGNTTVTFDDVAAPILYTAAGQIGTVVPYAIGAKSATRIQVQAGSLISNPILLPVAAAAPAFFTTDESGKGAIVAFNQDGSYNQPSTPADPGSTMVLFATGAGETTPAGVDGIVATSVLPKPVAPVRVFVEGQECEIINAGAAAGLVAGVMQITARLPSPLTTGGAVEIRLEVGGIASSPGTTIAVH